MLLLADITNVDRTDLKPYCLLLETKDRRIHLALRSDDEVYGWKDDIYARTTLMGVSNPVNFVHKIHVGFDPTTGNFTVRVLLSTILSPPSQFTNGRALLRRRASSAYSAYRPSLLPSLDLMTNTSSLCRGYQSNGPAS
jgi:hypothetical protein